MSTQGKGGATKGKQQDIKIKEALTDASTAHQASRVQSREQRERRGEFRGGRRVIRGWFADRTNTRTGGGGAALFFSWSFLRLVLEWDQAKPAGPVGICAFGVQGGAYKYLMY